MVVLSFPVDGDHLLVPAGGGGRAACRRCLFFVIYLLIVTFMVLNLFIAVVVNAMQAQVTEDLRDDGEAQTQAILEEMRAMRLEVEALRRDRTQ